MNSTSASLSFRDEVILRFAGTWPEAIYWAIAITMLMAFALTLVLFAIDVRTIDGYVSVWTKPLKFELSLALHAGTLALVAGLLSPPYRQGAGMMIVALAFLAACTVEMSWIILQGVRAEPSHFNVSTPFYRFMWSMMAFCAVVILGAAGAVGLAAAADGHVSASSAFRAAIILGLVGGTVLTLVTAFTIGGRMSPYVGGVPAFDARMALTGWSRTSGDLRVSHFLATHMIQALPLAALAIDRVLAGRAALAAVFVAAAIWTVLTLTEYGTALSGLPSPVARAMP